MDITKDIVIGSNAGIDSNMRTYIEDTCYNCDCTVVIDSLLNNEFKVSITGDEKWIEHIESAISKTIRVGIIPPISRKSASLDTDIKECNYHIKNKEIIE